MTTAALNPRTPAARGTRGTRTVQRPGSAAAAVLTLSWAGLVGFVREPMAFVMGLLYPLFMLILFNAVFPGEMNGGITFGGYG